jgi:hypothetical protein
MLERNFRIEADRATNRQDRNRYMQYAAEADHEALAAEAFERKIAERITALTIVAPRDGVVMGVPRKEEIGKHFEDFQSRPVCVVGDLRHLKVTIPVAPYDYELLKRDMQSMGDAAELPVSIRVPGTNGKVYHGRLTKLPNADSKVVPAQLTFQGGGSLAVKPGGNPNALEPQSQVFLVEVMIEDPDHRIQPGVLPTVKIHCHWRSAAWWAWRAINIAVDMDM